MAKGKKEDFGKVSFGKKKRGVAVKKKNKRKSKKPYRGQGR